MPEGTCATNQRDSVYERAHSKAIVVEVCLWGSAQTDGSPFLNVFGRAEESSELGGKIIFRRLKPEVLLHR